MEPKKPATAQRDEQPLPMIGQKYAVLGTLGRGGFGVVYLAFSTHSMGAYALKTFRDEYLTDPSARESFRKEAAVWVALDRHPHIVRAISTEELSGRLYIAMEYVAPNDQGLNSLEGYLRHFPLDTAQSLRWAIQFCYGMQYAYSKGVHAHRDIKPANILIDRDKNVRITDFGLALALNGTGTPSWVSVQPGHYSLSMPTAAGTPTHMSPEQFVAYNACDHRSDIYSFGVVLFQMATAGQLPFMARPPQNDTEYEVSRFFAEMRSLHEKADVPAVSSPIHSVIRRCLSKRPQDRYQSFDELRTDLEHLLQQQTGEVIRAPELRDLDCWEWEMRGQNMATLGNAAEAIRCFDKAVELAPSNIAILNGRANGLNRLGRYEEAIRYCDEALRQNGHYSALWWNRGASLVPVPKVVMHLQPGPIAWRQMTDAW